MYRESELCSDPSVVTVQSVRPRDLRSAWPLLVERVRRGDARAVAEFGELSRPGVRLLLKLNLSGVGLEQLLDETVAGAVEEIRRGWIREPRDLAEFVRKVVDRNAAATSRPGATDQARVRQRATDLENALRHFPPEQRVWLTHFYVDGWDAARVCLASGLSDIEFAALRRRLREAAGLTPSRLELTLRDVQPKVRAAAMG